MSQLAEKVSQDIISALEADRLVWVVAIGAAHLRGARAGVDIECFA